MYQLRWRQLLSVCLVSVVSLGVSSEAIAWESVQGVLKNSDPDHSDSGSPETVLPGNRNPCNENPILITPRSLPLDFDSEECMAEPIDPVQTAATTPSLWFYIPDQYAELYEFELTLSQNGQRLDTLFLDPVCAAGLMEVPITTALPEGDRVQWELMVMVERFAGRSGNPRVTGDIQRSSTPTWYDQLQSLEPEGWDTVLTEAGLGAIAPQTPTTICPLEVPF